MNLYQPHHYPTYPLTFPLINRVKAYSLLWKLLGGPRKDAKQASKQTNKETNGNAYNNMYAIQGKSSLCRAFPEKDFFFASMHFSHKIFVYTYNVHVISENWMCVNISRFTLLSSLYNSPTNNVGDTCTCNAENYLRHVQIGLKGCV